MAIQNAREGVAGDAQYPCRLRHVQAERYQAVFPDAAAGVGGKACSSLPLGLSAHIRTSSHSPGRISLTLARISSVRRRILGHAVDISTKTANSRLARSCW